MVDVVVVVVVVVVAAWQTEMLTVVPLFTCARWRRVLAVDVARLGPAGARRVEGRVGDQAGAGDGGLAAAGDWPTTPGTETQLPLETTRLTERVGRDVAPGGGVLRRHQRRLGLARAGAGLAAHVQARLAQRARRPRPATGPSTLGTDTEVWVPETVRTHLACPT